MGMDGLFLVMEVEEHFGIAIRDEEAPQILRTIVREVVHIDRLCELSTRSPLGSAFASGLS